MEDFVTYEIAVKLKEKGFKDKCFGYYTPEGYEFLPVQTPFYGGDYEDCMFSHNDMRQGLDGSDCVDAPTISQVLKWLRENKKLHVSIMTFMFRAGWCYEVVRLGENPKLVAAHRNSYNTYEKAALAGIEYVLNNLI